jgi:hypothetical protein
MSLAPKHYALIAGCALGIGAMTSALHSWNEALTPQFIGGVIGVLGTQIGAILSDKPSA